MTETLNCAMTVTVVHIEALVRDLPDLVRWNARSNIHEDHEAALEVGVAHLYVKGLVDGQRKTDMVLMNDMEG